MDRASETMSQVRPPSSAVPLSAVLVPTQGERRDLGQGEQNDIRAGSGKKGDLGLHVKGSEGSRRARAPWREDGTLLSRAPSSRHGRTPAASSLPAPTRPPTSPPASAGTRTLPETQCCPRSWPRPADDSMAPGSRSGCVALHASLGLSEPQLPGVEPDVAACLLEHREE